MRVIIFLLAIAASACSTTNSYVNIPPKETIAVKTPAYAMNEAAIKNKSGQDLEVKVVNKESGNFVRGFGLAPKAKANVMVEKDSELRLANPTNKALKVSVDFNEMEMPLKSEDTERYISFTLNNKSATSIPLIIPNVMNPNLSPFSNSGVDLKIGQEILFKANGRRHVLLVVDDSIEEGEKIEVSQLLKERKKELGIK